MFGAILEANTLALSVSDWLHSSDKDGPISTNRDAVKEGEMVTERRVKRWLLRKLRDDVSGVPYRAAGDLELHAKVDTSERTLEVGGIIYAIDLHHRPFRFQNMMPDPYWETRRRREDEIGNQCTGEGISGVIISGIPSKYQDGEKSEEEGDGGKKDDEDEDDDIIKVTHGPQVSALAHKLMDEMPSMVPNCTLDSGIEKYALGRSFFAVLAWDREMRGPGTRWQSSLDRVCLLC